METMIEKDRPVLFIRGFPLDLKKALKVAAVEQDQTLGEVVAEAVRQYLVGRALLKERGKNRRTET